MASSLAQSVFPTGGQLASFSCSQINVTAPATFTEISRKSSSPHKNILGNGLPSLGQITTSSANGITGFVVLVPNRVTSYSCTMDRHGAIAVLKE